MHIFKSIVNKSHTIFMSEGNVTKALSAIQKTCDSIRLYNRMTVLNCGWKAEDWWFIAFDCSDKDWNVLIRKLGVIRVYENTDIPDKDLVNFYTTD